MGKFQLKNQGQFQQRLTAIRYRTFRLKRLPRVLNKYPLGATLSPVVEGGRALQLLESLTQKPLQR